MKVKKILLATLLIAIYAGFLISFLEISANNIALGILLIITLFTVFLIFGKISIKSSFPSLRKFSPFFYSLSIIVGIVFVSGFTIMAAQNFISLKKAEKLINNIDQYKQESGHFPATLEELSPNFYSKIPKSNIGFLGRDFNYTINKKSDNLNYSPFHSDFEIQEYKLSYQSSFGVEYSYISQFQSWESSSEYDFEKIKSVNISEPLTGFFISSSFTKDYKQK